MIRLSLYQPDIAGNVGAIMRLCACMGLGLDIIEPCGFAWNEKKIKASALDYWDHLDYQRHSSWQVFYDAYKARRIVLMTTKTDTVYTDFAFRPDDVLLAGSESSGVPEHVHEVVGAQVTIPMSGAMRSLNIGMASAMLLGEVRRQIDYG